MMHDSAHITLVIGGCRSGKSRHAQQLAEEAAPRRIYVATCVPRDPEMHDRVRRHRKARDDSWQTLESPLDLTGVIREQARPGVSLLVDCLTLWVTNLLLEAGEPDAGRVETAARDLVAGLGAAKGPVFLVSNEVGQGIVPGNALARSFRDCAGLINQEVAAAAGRVVWMVAGIPVVVKPSGGRGETP
jgi:adenosylcobinamide kinase/adenosylcobinamide-phosphate guanylyltransferase